MASNTGSAQDRPKGNIAARLGAMILVIVGAIFLIVSILGFLPDEPRITLAGLLFLGILGLLLGGAGVLWLRSLAGREAVEQTQLEEKAVMNLVASNGGAVTVAQLAQGMQLTATEAESLAERMMGARLLEPELRDDGTVVYRLRGLAS
jgi:hypothetical protein